MKNILFVLLILFTDILSAQQTKVDLEKLDAYFEKTAKDWNIPGMSVGIVKDGEIVFSKGYGVLEVNKPEKPDGNTLYAIASNSKAFTSAIIAMLVQEGKLNWDDKVQKYLPYFQLKNPEVSMKMTIKDSCVAFKSVKVTDTLLVRFSVKVSSLDKGQLIKVYPNPAQNQLTIDNGNYSDFAGYTVNVYNSIGAVVYTQAINQKVYTIDLKSWSSVGVYRMELTDKSGAKIAVKTIVLN